MVQKTPRQVAAIKKAKENKDKDTSEKLAIAIQLHPRGDFADAEDYNKYKKLVQGGMSARRAWKEYILYLRYDPYGAVAPNESGSYPGERGPYQGPYE